MAKILQDHVEITERHTKLNRWGGKSFIRVHSPLPDVSIIEEVEEQKVGKGKGKVRTKYKQKHQDKEVHIYEIEKLYPAWDSIGELEYEIYLKKPPETNRFELTIDHSGDLDFFFQGEQPPKTQEQIEAGEVRGYDIWPEVLNSYAIYHKWNSGNEYKCGKFGQIFRPKVYDADENWVWCDFDRTINPADGKLVIVIPQEFLDTAKYPIVIDPTFGYETIGVGGTTTIEWVIVGSVWRCPFTGTVETISMYTTCNNVGRTYSAAIYRHDTLALVVGETAVTPSTSPSTSAWRDVTISPAGSVTEGVDYVLAAWASSGTGNHTIAYDTSGTANQGHTQASTASFTWPDPLNPTHNNNIYSIHADGTGSSSSSSSKSSSSSSSKSSSSSSSSSSKSSSSSSSSRSSSSSSSSRSSSSSSSSRSSSSSSSSRSSSSSSSSRSSSCSSSSRSSSSSSSSRSSSSSSSSSRSSSSSSSSRSSSSSSSSKSSSSSSSSRSSSSSSSSRSPAALPRPAPLTQLPQLLQDALVDEPRPLPRGSRGAGETGYVRPGFRPELDALRESAKKGREWVAGLEQRERERTGIASLMVRFHPVLGYGLEVTKANQGRVPADYERR